MPRPPPWVHILTWFDLAENFHLDEVDSADFISEIFRSFGPIRRVKRATPTPLGLNFNLFGLKIDTLLNFFLSAHRILLIFYIETIFGVFYFSYPVKVLTMIFLAHFLANNCPF